MTRHRRLHRRQQQQAQQEPPRTEPDAGAHPAAWRWGQAAALTWYLGGFAVLLAGALTETGPYASVARWQVEHLGANSAMGSFLPGFGVLLLPMLVLACLPRRADWPFVAGAKEAFWPKETRRRALPAAEQARVMRRTSRVMAGLAAAAVAGAAILCTLSLRPGEQKPGSALPVLSLAQATAADALLPPYARLSGAVVRPAEAWAHDYSIRSTRYHDVYVPLTGPDWRPGDPVQALLLENGIGPGAAAPPEGKLSSGLPAWLVGAMRDAGLNSVDAPVVLTHQALNGAVPAPDGIDAVVFAIIGGSMALVFGGMAFSFRRTYRRLVRGEAGRAAER